MEERSYPSFLLCMDYLHIYFLFLFLYAALFLYSSHVPPLSLLAGKYMVNLEKPDIFRNYSFIPIYSFLLSPQGHCLCSDCSWCRQMEPMVRFCRYAGGGTDCSLLLQKGRFKDFLICQGIIVSFFVFSVWFTFGVTVTRLFTSESIALELKKLSGKWICIYWRILSSFCGILRRYLRQDPS